MGIDDLKSSFRRRRVEARVLLDGSLLDEHARLEAALAKAMKDDVLENRLPAAPGLTEQIQALEQRIDDEQKIFVFEGIGQYAWQNLAADNGPTKEQRAAGYDMNPELFAPKALAASCVDPALSEDDAAWLMLNLDVAEWDRLFSACLTANIGERDRPKSWVATAAATVRNGSSTTAPPEESLAQSS